MYAIWTGKLKPKWNAHMQLIFDLLNAFDAQTIVDLVGLPLPKKHPPAVMHKIKKKKEREWETDRVKKSFCIFLHTWYTENIIIDIYTLKSGQSLRFSGLFGS